MFQPDELVLARMGTTYWPGKILGPSENNKYKVYFYGDYKTADVCFAKIKKYTNETVKAKIAPSVISNRNKLKKALCEIKKVDLENKLDFSLKNKPSNYMCIDLTNNFTCKPVINKLHSSQSINEMISNDHKAKCLVLKQSIYDLNNELNSESSNKLNKRNSLFKIVSRNEISSLSLKVLGKTYTNQNLESMLNEVSKDSKLDLKKKDKKILKALKGNSSSAEVIKKLKKQSVQDKRKIKEHEDEIKRLKFINFKQRINFEVKIDSKSYKNDYAEEELILESSGNTTTTTTTSNNNNSKDDDDDDKDFADIDAMIISIPEKEYREKLEFQTKCGLKFDYLKIFEDREKKLTILNKKC